MSLALEIGIVALGGIVAILLIPPVPRRPAKRPQPRPPQRPDDLRRIERVVFAQRFTQADVHGRLRPMLREIAQPLARRNGVRLEHDHLAARELLGNGLSELVRPDRSAPRDLRAPGLTRAELEAIVDRLEEL